MLHVFQALPVGRVGARWLLHTLDDMAMTLLPLGGTVTVTEYWQVAVLRLGLACIGVN